MDRALKERIIGAAVLVVVVVLVVPVFLDGPPDEPEIVSERVPLPGQAEQGETRTVILARDREQPVPAVAERTEPEPRENEPPPDSVAPKSNTGSVPAASGEPAQQAAASAAPPAQSAATASTTGMWAVQLGSFGNKQNAERLAADLRKQGYAAFLSQLSTPSGSLHRVRVGPQKDRASAEETLAQLQKAGHKGQVVPHP